MLDKFNYLRQNSEIVLDPTKVRAEGQFPRRYGSVISYEDIQRFLGKCGFKAGKIQMTLDAVTCVWYWNCNIRKISNV